MESRKFADVLREAIAGKYDAVEAVIWRYLPLINRHSALNGTLDEDLRQYILTRVVERLPKFDMSEDWRK